MDCLSPRNGYIFSGVVIVFCSLGFPLRKKLGGFYSSMWFASTDRLRGPLGVLKNRCGTYTNSGRRTNW